ncbi:hypothetical protein U1Q18_003367 [Sarracenia purpurea var. burkii]
MTVVVEWLAWYRSSPPPVEKGSSLPSEVKLAHGLEMNSSFGVTGMISTSQAGEARVSTSPVNGAGDTVVAASEHPFYSLGGDPGVSAGKGGLGGFGNTGERGNFDFEIGDAPVCVNEDKGSVL